MRKLDIDVSEIKRLVELVEKHSLEELVVEDADLYIMIRGRAPSPQVVETAAADLCVAEARHPEPLPTTEHSTPKAAAEDLYEITAPLVGVFYRSPAPDAPPFVEIGDEIEVGSEIGLIEAMKVFSPIPSEVAGVVVDIPAENGKLVQQGEVLVRVRVGKE